MILMFFKAGMRITFAALLCLLITHFYYEYRVGEELYDLNNTLAKNASDSDILTSAAEIVDEFISFLKSKLNSFT